MGDAASAGALSGVGGSGRFVYVVAAAAAVGGLLFGYDTGIISAALLSIAEDFAIGSGMQQIVVSAILVGAILGALGSGRLSDRLGRRPVVLITAIVFGVGALAAAFAPNVALLILARLLLGVAVGASSQIVPVYIAELSPARTRGGLVVLFQLMITVGILAAYVAGYAFSGGSGWRQMFGLGVVPALVLALAMIVLPESPRWLLIHRGADAAARVLRRVRGAGVDVAAEVAEIEASRHDEGGRFRDLLAQRWVRPALVAGLGLAMFSQITGVNVVIYYAPTILATSGFGESAAILATVGVGVVNMLMVIAGTLLVDRIGRRRLLLVLLPLAVLSLVVLGAVFLGGDPEGAGRGVAVAAIMGFIAFNGGSLSVVLWLYGSEVFPLSVRGAATSASALTVWVFNLLVALTTLSLTEGIGVTATFWMFAVVNALAWLFVLRLVPETKGRSLEQIESSLRAGTFRAGGVAA
jgi:sugar porter (SP) family MFS transporter